MFCSAGGSGDFASSPLLSIPEQIQEARNRICAKTNCKKFIAYFQAYTNTYAPVDRLREIFESALAQPEIVALSIATRADCLPEEVLDLLEELNHKKPVWVELGLQSIHNETLRKMRTHTSVEQFDEAVRQLSKRGLLTVAHLILGWPNETREQMLASVRHLGTLPVWGVKLQLLHVLKDTALASRYLSTPFPLPSLEEYCNLVIDCVELLPPDVVVHRLTGDGPKNLLLAPLWSANKKHVLNTMHQRFRERDAFQSRLYRQ